MISSWIYCVRELDICRFIYLFLLNVHFKQIKSAVIIINSWRSFALPKKKQKCTPRASSVDYARTTSRQHIQSLCSLVCRTTHFKKMLCSHRRCCCSCIVSKAPPPPQHPPLGSFTLGVKSAPSLSAGPKTSEKASKSVTWNFAC